MSSANAPFAQPAFNSSDSALRRGATFDQSSSAACSVGAMPLALTAFERSRLTTTSVPSRPPSFSDPSFMRVPFVMRACQRGAVKCFLSPCQHAW
jgi:hypothetical protein